MAMELSDYLLTVKAAKFGYDNISSTVAKKKPAQSAITGFRGRIEPVIGSVRR
jgi:hypothetical protein